MFPSLQEFSTDCCDLHSQRLSQCQWNRSRCFSGIPSFFLYDPKNPDSLISDSSAFSKLNSYICKCLVHVLLKPSLQHFEHYLASMWSEHSCVVAWTFFGVALLWDWNEYWPFQSCGHCWVLQADWHSAALSEHHLLGFEIAGISSPSLDLFVVMLPKAQLTSYSRLSGSR